MGIIYRDSDGIELEYLTQWDVNRKIIISGIGIDHSVAMHFFNSKSESALTVPSVFSEGDLIADIPNLILQEGLPITVCLFDESREDDEGKTIYTFKMPVYPRPKPNDYEYEENIEYTSWVELTKEARVFLEALKHVSFRAHDGYLQVMTDGETWTNVMSLSEIKGEKGDKGAGISGIVFNSDYTLTIYFEDPEIPPYTTGSIRGAQGDRGFRGNGITSIVLTSGDHSPGTTDTYTIHMTDAVTDTTFTVYNGSDGLGGDMFISTYDPNNHSEDIFAYADDVSDNAIEEHNDDPDAHSDLFDGKASIGSDGKVISSQLPDLLELGNTSDTAYRGDYGESAYLHSGRRGTGTYSLTNPHGLSPSDIGAAGTSVATESENGLMSSGMVSKLNGIEAGANKYTLPAATTEAMGGIIVGYGLAITDGVLSVSLQPAEGVDF